MSCSRGCATASRSTATASPCRTHRLIGDGEEITFDFDTTGSGLAQVLGAVYAVERLDPASRHIIVPVLHRAMRWEGPIGPALIAHLAGAAPGARWRRSLEPVAWALDVLGFPPGTRRRRRGRSPEFRAQLHGVHPDHGGDEVDAAAIFELAEARGSCSDRLRPPA